MYIYIYIPQPKLETRLQAGAHPAVLPAEQRPRALPISLL